MIPKIIHYCWFGRNKKPNEAKKCIESWKTIFSDYAIVEWNEDNFDFSDCDYAKQAFENKKWAFLSDYARFKILFEYGGLYFDTDVETISSFENVIAKGPFLGQEISFQKDKIMVAPGLGIGFEPQNWFCRAMLEEYKNRVFNCLENSVQETIVDIATNLLYKHGLKTIIDDVQCVEGIYIYPSEYFCPKNPMTGELIITSNTLSIHHYSASWYTKKEQKWYQKELHLSKKYGSRFEYFRKSYVWLVIGSLYKYGFFKTLKKIFKKRRKK